MKYLIAILLSLPLSAIAEDLEDPKYLAKVVKAIAITTDDINLKGSEATKVASIQAALGKIYEGLQKIEKCRKQEKGEGWVKVEE